MVSRGECQYRREDLRALPARKRMQAGKLALARHMPSSSARSYVAWTGGVAHFWFWTAAEADEHNAAGQRRWIPETLLLAPPASDGVRLLRLSQGYEAQFWQNGTLASSQWWEQLPAHEAWLRFVRSTGLDPITVQDVPAPTSLPWSNKSWGEASWAQQLMDLLDEKTVWLLLFAILAAGVAWQVFSLLRWQAAGDQLSVRVERLREEVGPLLTAREQAEQALAELEHLSALRTPNDDYVLMADVATRLPENSKFASWKREAGKLQVILRSAEADPRAFVLAFEGSDRLSDVTVTPLANGAMQLVFELPVTHAEEAKGGDHE
ncbi:hypothetical protein ABB33_01390 [Stenotrophomonas acidaminiphila]|nr:hypothetical protein ABB33_01390 [Stenotrophomonas acidaminiphila]